MSMPTCASSAYLQPVGACSWTWTSKPLEWPHSSGRGVWCLQPERHGQPPLGLAVQGGCGGGAAAPPCQRRLQSAHPGWQGWAGLRARRVPLRQLHHHSHGGCQQLPSSGRLLGPDPLCGRGEAAAPALPCQGAGQPTACMCWLLGRSSPASQVGHAAATPSSLCNKSKSAVLLRPPPPEETRRSPAHSGEGAICH